MPLPVKKDEYLSNVLNKQKFIFKLGDHLTAAGFNVIYAKGDADLTIV
jgi:hypothetical protein